MQNWNAVYRNTKVFQIYWFDQYLAAFPEKQKNSRTSIKAIIRPKGEAGNHKRGFILYDAMEMNKLENDPVLYDRMRVSVDSKMFWATYKLSIPRSRYTVQGQGLALLALGPGSGQDFDALARPS